jgi:hypothetical protein
MFRAAAALSFGLLAALALSSPAHAGYKFSSEVNIWSSGFQGSLGSARNSPDGVQFIGCFASSATTGACFARNAAGTSKFCSFNTAELAAQAHSMNGDAWLNVVFDTSGACTSIRVDHNSTYEPKN